ncbi:hypothetical protein J1605_009697 [Eschrichtius robustus]|uniref:Suppressor of tumorigenicity 7 protein n=1 Tax=Eschrichtius robustus TaxID=9764 RepID=A0AB34GUB5_ESCRO|nr:hypothetical protein J1605_009697 [Eschrichtius robustus]
MDVVTSGSPGPGPSHARQRMDIHGKLGHPSRSARGLSPLLPACRWCWKAGVLRPVRTPVSQPQYQSLECKVWRNPLNLFRGAEYNRYTWVTGREPLTYYDMNLSAQDHQTFFTCDSDHLRPADAIMQKAWRERNPQARISAAHEALEINECATAYILLAEEEATTIAEAEKLFKQALKAGDGCYRRSQQLQHHGSQYEAQHSKVSSRTRHQCLGLHQKKASNVCQKTREDQRSSENDERCEFEFMFGNSDNAPDLQKEEPTEWGHSR